VSSAPQEPSGDRGSSAQKTDCTGQEAAPTLSRQMLISGFVLAAFAALGALGLAATDAVTAPRIVAKLEARLERELQVVLPEGDFDAAVSQQRRALDAPATLERLGTRQPATLFTARREGRTVAVVFDVTTPQGYSGDIRLLIGVRADGSLSGVRAVEHRETPGLGDKIDAARTDWIKTFAGLRLGQPPARDWKVKRDGGVFDQFSGATVTPRAVVEQVRRVLEFVAARRSELFADAPADAGAAGDATAPTPRADADSTGKPT